LVSLSRPPLSREVTRIPASYPSRIKCLRARIPAARARSRTPSAAAGQTTLSH
jgi:hypothetical protein